MSALPMLARCANAQWRGLTDTERARLVEMWAQARLPAPLALQVVRVGQTETPIWTVAHPLGYSLTLVSVKHDALGFAGLDGARP